MTARPGRPARCPGTSRCTVAGTRSSRSIAWIASTAWPSATPGARLNDSVTAGNWPWWLTEQRLDLRGEMGEACSAAPAPRRARRHRSSTARSGRSGTAAGPRGRPCTGWSRCRSSRPGAGRTRRRASGRSAAARCPSREAASRSISIARCGAAICWSEATSCSSGSFFIAASRIGAQWLSSSMSVSVSVYWYCVRLRRPPTLMSCRTA